MLPKRSHQRHHEAVEGTGRLEAFSDGVIAIIVTILILEIHVPEIVELTNSGAWDAVIHLLPKLAGFFVSFITVAIFWVNHHHFFHPISKSDGPLLWYNNILLFWLAVVPFVTAFVGDYPDIPLVVALYGFVLFMAAMAFTLMIRYVFFKSDLLPQTTSLATRKMQFRRTLFGPAAYGIATLLAFIHPYIALGIFFLVPLFYFLPQRIRD